MYVLINKLVPSHFCSSVASYQFMDLTILTYVELAHAYLKQLARGINEVARCGLGPIL